ncbi:protein GUCD1 [Patella vulgata]|uniref:protein GUCD1 n=1 Tax=Patella vulgata TaxID=6465 RepID=UPI00218055DA|nr:protein GUCD1 [Patella vulgata]
MASELEDDGVVNKSVDIPHVTQFYSWDCGLACAHMILKYLGKPCDKLYTTDLDYLQCEESVWTIHLAYLMKRYNIAHQLFTITLGVNEGYASKSFYSRFFCRDEGKVNNLFTKAAEYGVNVEKRCLSLKEITDYLKDGTVAICLTDWVKLECIWCRNMVSCLSCFIDICHTGYQGHFVVLVGFDSVNKHIFYKNPNSSKEVLCCSRYEQFDRARKSSGTDEDILFIFNKDDVIDS